MKKFLKKTCVDLATYYIIIIKKGGKEKLNMWAIVRPEPCNEI